MREIVMPPGKSAADLKQMMSTDLAKAKIEVEPEHLEIGYPHPNDKLNRSQAKFVGRVGLTLIQLYSACWQISR